MAKMTLEEIKNENVLLCQILETSPLAKQLAVVWVKSETSERAILKTSKDMHNVLSKQAANKAVSGLSILQG